MPNIFGTYYFALVTKHKIHANIFQASPLSSVFFPRYAFESSRVFLSDENEKSERINAEQNYIAVLPMREIE